MIFSLVSITSGYSRISIALTELRCLTLVAELLVGDTTMADPIGPRANDVMTAPMSPMERRTPPSAGRGTGNVV